MRTLKEHCSYRLFLLLFFTVLVATYQHTACGNTPIIIPPQNNGLAESGNSQSTCTQTFESIDHDGQRSVYGEIQQMPAKIRRPEWPIKSDAHQILVVNSPLSDETILPYSAPVPNTADNKNITVVASPSEYEPASFVLRAGTHQLSNVTLTSHDLVSADNRRTIPAKNIDIRVVKPWYQSAQIMRRVQPGQTKQFVPELLWVTPGLVYCSVNNNA